MISIILFTSYYTYKYQFVRFVSRASLTFYFPEQLFYGLVWWWW